MGPCVSPTASDLEACRALIRRVPSSSLGTQLGSIRFLSYDTLLGSMLSSGGSCLGDRTHAIGGDVEDGTHHVEDGTQVVEDGTHHEDGTHIVEDGTHQEDGTHVGDGTHHGDGTSCDPRRILACRPYAYLH